MSEAKNQKISFFLQLTAWAVAILPLVGILYWQPGPGLMDDANLLFNVYPRFAEQGFWISLFNFIERDFVWGMFRPTYVLLIHALYGPASTFGDSYLFVANYIWAILAYGAICWVISRYLEISFTQVIVFLGSLMFAYDLFQYPSLQEKILLLVGAAYLWSAIQLKDNPRWFISLLAFQIIGVGTKASFLIWIVIANFILFEQSWFGRGGRKFLAIHLLTSLCSFFFLYLVSSRGLYTQTHYELAKILPNLFSRNGLLFLLPLAIFFCVCGLRQRLKAFMPAVAIAAFLALFLPWQIGSYIQTIVLPFVAALGVLTIRAIKSQKIATCLLLGICGASILMASYRSYSMFARLYDLKRFVQSSPDLPTQGVFEVFVPCEEGSESVKLYVENRKRGGIKIIRVSPDLIDPDGKVFFYDQALCIFGGRLEFPRDCQDPLILQQPSFKKSFRLVRCS